MNDQRNQINQANHLSPLTLTALADGELSSTQLAAAEQHLALCPSCTSSALTQTLLKSATARAGHRYTPSASLQQRLARLASQPIPAQPTPRTSTHLAPSLLNSAALGWLAAAAVLLLAVGVGLFQYRTQTTQQTASTAGTPSNPALSNLNPNLWPAEVTEVSDQHIATLANALPPQVLSTDRHTVKPWFQGKIPFSFNLPDNLPADTKLEGANLTYLANQPVAQLLYSIGKHRVSIFLRESPHPASAGISNAALEASAEHSGFHIRTFRTGTLEAIAVSDVEPTRLSGLLNLLGQAQTQTRATTPKPTS